MNSVIPLKILRRPAYPSWWEIMVGYITTMETRFQDQAYRLVVGGARFFDDPGGQQVLVGVLRLAPSKTYFETIGYLTEPGTYDQVVARLKHDLPRVLLQVQL